MRRVRYAVVGLGRVAQVAMIPAFERTRNSKVVAFISHNGADKKKLSYDDYEECLLSGNIDAVYIALPNHLHQEYAERAARRNIHVLCEKPMALTEKSCRQMIEVAKQHHVKLMIAYRLYFEKANMKAADIARSGKLGELRAFNSTFTMPAPDRNDIRSHAKKGGGTLYDIGIHCINAARYLFRDEPIEVVAISTDNADKMMSSILKFHKERLATFTCSFGTSDTAVYEIIGTKGHLRVESAYNDVGRMTHELVVGGKVRRQTFSRRDQFAAELTYFSDCILHNRKPEPSGEQGLVDVRIINALYESAKIGRAIFMGERHRISHEVNTTKGRLYATGK